MRNRPATDSSQIPAQRHERICQHLGLLGKHRRSPRTPFAISVACATLTHGLVARMIGWVGSMPNKNPEYAPGNHSGVTVAPISRSIRPPSSDGPSGSCCHSRTRYTVPGLYGSDGIDKRLFQSALPTAPSTKPSNRPFKILSVAYDDHVNVGRAVGPTLEVVGVADAPPHVLESVVVRTTCLGSDQS